MSEPTPGLTVYYDGSCPLCRAEIAHYKAERGADAIGFEDVAACGARIAPDLDRATALARFHVRRADGTLASGAKAFVEVWSLLPRWRWAARLARLPGAMSVLEAGYRASTVIRPLLVGVMRVARRGQP